VNDVKRLVEPLIPALRRYAGVLIRDRDAADDLVQDCLERAISRWGQRRADSDTRTWLFAILHNLAVSRLRQKARRGEHLALETVGDSAALSQAPDQEHRLRHAELLRALADLPEDQRSVVLLVSVEDLSYAEAARVVGAPIGTVMSRLSRGRERLRRAMAGESVPAPRAHLRRVK
jgi:RNA polymerase sigma-70 factor (ECF subfamily)